MFRKRLFISATGCSNSIRGKETSRYRNFVATHVDPVKFDRSASAKLAVISRTLMTSTPKKVKDGATVRKVILTQCAPKPVGPYSQAVQFDKTLYISGVLGLDKNKMELVEGGAGDQAKQALINMGHILKAAGSTYENVIKTTIFLANIGDFKEVNDVYKDFFTTNPPARSTYQVAKLPLEALVEIEAIAGTGEIQHESCNCGKL
ncbi:hypothetical protein HHI36_021180 [Cryptolaemus montrouzieri]|uniref:2-iminobutanoate/2-iminopropanoate deaminase n=1 Tax=Cryptolaemus montrouzieri TaxID=559131 RepID=A0ABD2MW59_9CUCU